MSHSFNTSCYSTSLTRLRQRAGEAGCEWLLTATIEAGLKLVVVDTTVQEKNISFPTGSKLYDRMRRHLVDIARRHGIALRQTYGKASREWLPKIGRYGHAKQYKRMRKTIKKIKKVKGYLGRVLRDLERQLQHQGIKLGRADQDRLAQAARLLEQTTKSKNKLYSLHEPDVDCISKGKAHKRYEFEVKASIATTAKEAFVVGARSYPENPYDGHTLGDQLQQVEVLTNQKPEVCYVDRGYKGSGVTETRVIIAGQKRGGGQR